VASWRASAVFLSRERERQDVAAGDDQLDAGVIVLARLTLAGLPGFGFTGPRGRLLG
jgi:hypothetical protein